MKKLSKMLLTLLIVFLLIVNVSAKTNGIKIRINNKEISSDVSPFIVNDRVLVPIRAISENLGYNVNWRDDNKYVTVYDGDNLPASSLILTITSLDDRGLFVNKDQYKNLMTVPTDDEFTKIRNSAYIYLDSKPIIKNDRIFVPLRLISEAFGNKVKWDDKNRTVLITGDIRNSKGVSTLGTDNDLSYHLISLSTSAENFLKKIQARNNSQSPNSIYDQIDKRKEEDMKLLLDIVPKIESNEGFSPIQGASAYLNFGGTVKNNSNYTIIYYNREYKLQSGSTFFVATTSSMRPGDVSETGAIGVPLSELSEADFQSMKASRINLKIIMPDGSERLIIYNGITQKVE